MDMESIKCFKWPTEGLNHAWGSTRGSLHTQFPPEQTEFQSAEAGMTDWFQDRCRVRFLAVAVLGIEFPCKS